MSVRDASFRDGLPHSVPGAEEWFARRDAGLSAAETREFQSWLEADPQHAAALARLEAAWTTFGKPVRAGATRDLIAELARRRTHRRRRRISAIAAALVALTTGGVFWRSATPTDAGPPLPATAALHVPTHRVLPDGTRVTLNEGAQIDPAFTNAERAVVLSRGEAHFEVTKDPTRPFVVRANGVSVKAVGTAFAVQVGAGAVEVLVTEGTVAVDQATTAAVAAEPREPSPGVFVTAGHRMILETSAPARAAPESSAVASEDIAGRLAWRNPRVEFSGTPLAEAIAFLNRDAAGGQKPTLVIADPQLAPLRVSGIFRTDNLEGFVLLLSAGFGVETQQTGNTIELRKAAAN